MGWFLLIPISIAVAFLLFVGYAMIQCEVENARRRRWYLEEITRIQKKYPLGSEIDYVGRKCRVIGHCEIWPMVGAIPMLKTRYSDEKGKIHSLDISPVEI